MPNVNNDEDLSRDIKAKAFLDACFTEYKTVRDEILATTGEFYRIVQFGSTAVLGAAGVATTFWKTEPTLVKTLLGLGIPTFAFVFAELLTGQVARIRKFARYCKSIEEKLQIVIGDPFGIKERLSQACSMGWESWLEGDSFDTDQHYPWIYVFGILLFFFASYCSLSAYVYFSYKESCKSFAFSCISSNWKSAAIIGVLIVFEIGKASVWYAQAKQIAHPLAGALFMPKEFKKLHTAYMSLSTNISHLRETAKPAGIILVGLQALALYLGFGIGAALVLLTVAATGTLASIIHNRRRSPDKIPEARSWKNAVANAGLATALAVFAYSSKGSVHRTFLAAVAAATLCATLSDTMSHEIGEWFGGNPRIITTWKRAHPGDNGAVSVLGSVVGIATAFALALWSAVLGMISIKQILWVAVAGCIGNLVDSLLGATVEDRFSLSNDVVNFCCVLSAALAAFIILC